MIRSIVSLPDTDSRWLHQQAREMRVSIAAIVREAVREYRRHVGKGGGLKAALRRTAGAWKSVRGDSQETVSRLRSEWGSRP